MLWYLVKHRTTLPYMFPPSQLYATILQIQEDLITVVVVHSARKVL